jgi:hypothetical protein
MQFIKVLPSFPGVPIGELPPYGGIESFGMFPQFDNLAYFIKLLVTWH